MAEQIVSPGVFTNEKDLSFLPAGISAIGATIIGPTLKGPAFVPTIVTSFTDFTTLFGGLSEETYVPYTVQNYLRNAGTVTVVRVLQEGGFKTGVVNMLITPPTVASATYNLTTATAVDTGSTAANLVGTSLANYTKLFVLTSSADLVNSVTLANASLTWYSASTQLTVTGSTFLSSSGGNVYYTALFQSQSLTLPSSSATTYTTNFTTYKTANTKLVGTIAATTTVGALNNIDFGTTTVSPVSTSLASNFAMTLQGTGVTAQSFSGSLVGSSANNLNTVLGSSIKGPYKGHMYMFYQDYVNGLSTGVLTFTSGAYSGTSNVINLSGSNNPYSAAETPWITSQLIAGQTTPNLFKFYTLADGTDTNTSVKISIINTILPTSQSYGSFTVLVRDFNDTDQRPIVLETFSNVTLDPNSSDYIARRIGDKYQQVSAAGDITMYGNYNNVSKYVRVSMDSAVDAGSAAITLKPFGITGYVMPVSSSYSTPAVSYVTQNTVINGAYNKRAYYGFNFSSNDNLNYTKPTPADAPTDSTVFNLSSCYVHPSASASDNNSTFSGGSSISGSTFSGIDVSNILKFTVALQSGFDGNDPAVIKKVGSDIAPANLFGMDCSSANAAGTLAYTKALNIMANADQFDTNLIVTPGATIANHPSIITTAIDVAETRGDCFVIADPVKQGQSVAAAITAVDGAGLDTSYAGTYWPWVKILDTDKNKPVWVPPSVVLPGVLAYNDTAAYEWFAPAGLNRGGIGAAIDIEKKLTFSDRDALYLAKINPIATFPNQGVCVWGQKTLQVQASALDRINVRRLLIALKKYIASSSRYLVFDNNTTETRQRFLNIVNPYLEKVKSRQGLYAFRVVMDETNNTPDVIDRNIMYGQIYLQPAKAAEFIVLDFNVLPTGATFGNA